MSAKIVNAKHRNITKVNCVSSLECQFDEYELLTRDGIRNVQSWIGRPKVQKDYTIEEFIPEGGVVCGFCRSRPFYVEEYEARLFQMYSLTSVKENFWSEMSRLAIHMGEHLHPP